MRKVDAVLDGGPGDGQIVQVAEYPDGVTRSRVWVTVIDEQAHVMEDDATLLDRAARAGAEWTIYVLRPADAAPDGAAEVDDAPAGPPVYVPAGDEQVGEREADLSLDAPDDIAHEGPHGGPAEQSDDGDQDDGDQLRVVEAVLRGGPGDGQTVTVPARRFRDGGVHPSSFIAVTIVGGAARCLDQPGEHEEPGRAGAAGGPIRYVLRLGADDFPAVPFEYCVAAEADEQRDL